LLENEQLFYVELKRTT